MTLKIGLIIGSLRKASYSRRVAQALGDLAPTGMTLKELAYGDLPIYNGDLEPETPKPWLRLRAEVLACDALLFVIPEYNRSIPGGVKNAIDVASKPTGKNCSAGKPGIRRQPKHGAAGRPRGLSRSSEALASVNCATMPRRRCTWSASPRCSMAKGHWFRYAATSCAACSRVTRPGSRASCRAEALH